MKYTDIRNIEELDAARRKVSARVERKGKEVLERWDDVRESYSAACSSLGGSLEVHLDKEDGELIAKLDVTKTGGTEKTYATSYNAFVRANYYEDELENATVRVKAYGENETFSLWSDNVVVTTYNF